MQQLAKLMANGQKLPFAINSLIALLLCITSQIVFSQNVSVTATGTDVVDGNTTSIATLTGTPGADGLISLREAILATNGEPAGATITITLPAGTILLTIPGIGETSGMPNAAIGDLDLLAPATGTKTINISGLGPVVSIISQTTGLDRIFDIHPNSTPGGGSITVNISGVKITGGVASAPVSGGAILAGRAGDAIIITDCLFDLNSAPSNGGAISQSSASAIHDLTISNSTFTNNTANTATGGAVNYAGRGNVSITSCTFSGNSSGTQGGALNITGTAPGAITTNILKNTFLNNVANGTTFGGAAIAVVNVSTLTINYNRFIGNTAAGVATGKNISTGGGSVGSMNNDNNWWGINTGPTGADILGNPAANWLQLKTTATPAPICTTADGPGNISTITTSFLSNSANDALAATNLTALVGLPVIWTSTLGTLGAPQQLTIQTNAEAINTFTSDGTGGTATINAQVDNVLSSDIIAGANIAVNSSSTAPTGATGTTTICSGGSTTLTVTGGSKGTGAITEWFTGSCGGTPAGMGDAITVSPTVTTTYYVRYNGECNITDCATVTVTIKTPSTAPTGATGTTTICSGGSTTLTVAGGSKEAGAITEWFTGSCGGIPAGTGDAITVSPTVTTTYYLRYNGECNITDCATVTVTIKTPSTAPTGATGTTTICSGGSTTLTVAGGSKEAGATTEWFTGSCGGTPAGTGDAITVSPTVTTTYYVRYSGECNTTACAEITVTVFSSVVATCSNNNPTLYYGFSEDRTATIKAIATGGTAPYTVSITMNRPLNCNVITSAGDELWSGVGGSSVNNICPAAGPGLTPVSTGTIGATGGFYSVNVTLMQDAVITATITDANGCIATCTTNVHAEDARCFADNSGNAKIKICHTTGNNSCHEICVNQSAVSAHLAHGDFLGNCTPNCEAQLYTKGIAMEQKPEALFDLFEVKVIPNPTENQFTLIAEGGGSEKINLIVYDVFGRIVKRIGKSEKGQQIRFGEDMKAGIYIAELVQGNKKKVLKLVKLH